MHYHQFLQNLGWGKDRTSRPPKAGIADRFQTIGEWQLLAVPNVESGEGFQTNGKLQTKPPAVPGVESEGRTMGRGLEVTVDWPVAGPVCTASAFHGALDWGEG